MSTSPCGTAGKALLAAALLAMGASIDTAMAAETSIPQQAAGPSSSLMNRYGPARPMLKTNSNWILETRQEEKELRKWDIVTVVVKYSATMTSEGEIYNKKKLSGDMVLSDWVLLNGLHLFPDPQGRGDPRVAGKVNNKNQSESTIEARDQLQFTIACHIVDIRPNGNLILEGRRSINVNEEYWDLALTAEARPEDVLPNNTILSEDLANFDVNKQQRGHVRDGYRRGWLLRIIDKFQLF